MLADILSRATVLGVSSHLHVYMYFCVWGSVCRGLLSCMPVAPSHARRYSISSIMRQIVAWLPVHLQCHAILFTSASVISACAISCLQPHHRPRILRGIGRSFRNTGRRHLNGAICDCCGYGAGA